MRYVGLTLLFACGVVHAADWQPLISTDNMRVWVDKSSLAQTGKYKKAWFRIWRLANQQGNAYTSFKEFNWTKQLDYFSCQERTSSTIQMLYYTGDIRTGDYLGGSTLKASQASFDEVAPETVGEQMLNYVCSAPSAPAGKSAWDRTPGT